MNRRTTDLLLLMVLAFFLSGCALLRPGPVSFADPEARRLMEDLARHNSGLSSFKGLGDLTLTGATGRHDLRLAWLCRAPDQMRFELLAITGNPLLSLAADGRYVYWLSHMQEGDFHRLRQKRLNLEKLIGIPVETGEILMLLAGRIPVREHDAVDLATGADGRRELRLKKRWRGEVQRIYFAGEPSRPVRIDFLTDFGEKTAWSVMLEDPRSVGDFEIPHEMIFAAGADMATLRVRRYWPAVETDDAVFVLTDKTGAGE